MRVLVSILFSAVALFAEDPQALTPSAQLPDNFNIPAQLSKTIDTNKCKNGDPVEMKTLEPVLISKGLVMPENTKLHGKILGAASRQNDKPSWLVLVLERAEWKQHNIPLHAFVASRITLKAHASGRTDNTFNDAANMPNRPYGQRAAPRASAPGRGTGMGPTGAPRDAVAESNDSPLFSDSALDDLRLLKANNGTVFLVSQQPHLKLPSGTMFMLRNQAIVEQNEAGTAKAVASSQ